MLPTWSLRRVLLAGAPCRMQRAMEAQLRALGARPLCAPDSLCEESLCRTLHEGRFACVIAPDLLRLHGDPQGRLDTLNTLLGEAREAGVPLVMLLSRACAQHDEETAQLFSHALGCSRGAFGDPISMQCVLYSDGDAQTVCRKALELGARFLSGERGCTGVFTLTQEGR